MAEPITIDGSQGEGGGQVLRTSLALAAITGTPFRLIRIRGRRRKPGLRQQHLTAVRAAATVCAAGVRGDSLGSGEVTFHPGTVRGGDFTFAVGTAGSATLVLQTVLPALLRADEPSRVTIEGGTHNPMAPPFEFVERCFLPLVERMGAKVSLALERHGFYPAGGGRLVAEIEPAARLEPLDLLEAGEVRHRRARVLLCKLPEHVARRELAVVQRDLGWSAADCVVEEVRGHHGPTNVLMLEVVRAGATEIVTAFGEVGVPAERVAGSATAELGRFLAAEVPVGAHLADQLLLPMALGAGGRFATLPLTEHSRTNIEVIRRFLDVQIDVDTAGERAVVVVRP